MKLSFLLSAPVALALAAALTLGGCGDPASSPLPAPSAPESAAPDATQGPEILRFIDAWGEWHETEVRADLPRHDYDWSLLTNENGSVTYADPRYTLRKGVDVSTFQGDIDWEKVKADGYDFAFVRVAFRGYGSAGNLKADANYAQNLRGARAAGLDVGAYVFSQAVNEQEAIEEAEFALELLEGFELTLPVVFDPELIRDDEARTDNVTGAQFTRNALAFCQKIEEAGYDSMIYSNMIWEAFYFDLKALSDYPIWYADYEPIPQTPYPFTFWQCACTGKVDGIQGNADIDVWFQEK